MGAILKAAMNDMIQLHPAMQETFTKPSPKTVLTDQAATEKNPEPGNQQMSSAINNGSSVEQNEENGKCATLKATTKGVIELYPAMQETLRNLTLHIILKGLE
ncbi:hypothetical protein ElyMa_000884600 [Elysia marginata]|uniref:Uncharacterized protein n=1 Tax=Elysia marginata TaxID=1093978 RepID=A0AAV4H7U4_9GAST|nr:hypothetical protein ElyMa_000884600 [Elysia marginata]